MALSLGTGPALVTSAVSTATTASFTPAAGALLVAGHVSNSATGSVNLDTMSDSNSGAWTMQALKSKNTGSTGGATTVAGGFAALWTATASGTAITVSATSPDGGAATQHALFVWVLTDTSTPTAGVAAGASGTTGLPSVALSGLTVGSYVFAVDMDWNATGPSAASYTPNTGQTLGGSDWVSGKYGGAIWRTTSTVAGTTQTMDLTGPAGQQWNVAALEIKAAATASPAPARKRVSLRQAVNRSVSF